MARIVRRAPGFGGCLGAVVFFCASLTPSLMPRGWLLQGIVGGITAAIGYGLGASIGSVLRGPVRSLVSRDIPPAAVARAWWTLTVSSAVAAQLSLVIGLRWQWELRQIMSVDQLPSWTAPLILLVAAGVAGLLVLIARSIRLGTRRLAALLVRFVPRTAAYLVAASVVAFLVYGFVDGFLRTAFLDAANSTASVTNGGTTPGIARPTSPYVSAGPGSEVSWDTLGKEGRDFIGKTPSMAELRGFAQTASHSKPVRDPIRIYVGLRSEGGYQVYAEGGFRRQARIAVRELQRTGAFRRKVLAVVTTTGTGWIDEPIARSLEYLYGGDTAIVGIQYSYLPSWISFLADRHKAVAAATALNREVYAAWSSLPEASRPQLIVAGESLGSFGIEEAFNGSLDDLMSHADGALLIGPPNMNPIRHEVTLDRDESSPPWRPIFERGRNVRFAQWPGDLRTPKGPWDRPRISYLANASDPVVWWDTDLLFTRPEWLDTPRGPDVSRHMRWIPIVTFWQVFVDLVYAQDVPPGHGHKYGTTIPAGWAALIPPTRWTQADTERLTAAARRFQ